MPQIEFTTEGASTVLEELISEFKDLMEEESKKGQEQEVEAEVFSAMTKIMF